MEFNNINRWQKPLSIAKHTAKICGVFLHYNTIGYLLSKKKSRVQNTLKTTFLSLHPS